MNYTFTNKLQKEYSSIRMQILDQLNRQILANPFTLPCDKDAVILVSADHESRKINEDMCKHLHTKKFTALSADTGTVCNQALPVPSEMVFQVGMRVMALRNETTRSGLSLFRKGNLGKVIGIKEEMNGILQLQVRFDNGNTVPVTAMDWHIGEGGYLQIPLLPAFALSFAESKGCCFPKVYIKAEGRKLAKGELLSALSRCQTLAGFRMDRPVSTEDLSDPQDITAIYKLLNL